MAVNIMLVLPNALASDGFRIRIPLYRQIRAKVSVIELMISKTRLPLSPIRFSFL